MNNSKGKDVLLPFPQDKIIRNGGGGGGGSDMLDRLEKRVDNLERDIAQIRVDLKEIAVRSESFAKTSDLLVLKESLLTHFDEKLKQSSDSMDAKLDKLADKRRWVWSGIVLPILAIAATMGTAMMAIWMK
ncbi:hypothetical protein ACUND6_04840 [Serratia sp. IR-2025]